MHDEDNDEVVTKRDPRDPRRLKRVSQRHRRAKQRNIEYASRVPKGFEPKNRRYRRDHRELGECPDAFSNAQLRRRRSLRRTLDTIMDAEFNSCAVEVRGRLYFVG